MSAICATRYKTARPHHPPPGPRGYSNQAGPTCGGNGRRPLTCVDIVSLTQPLTRQEKAVGSDRTTGHILLPALIKLNIHIACTRTHACKGRRRCNMQRHAALPSLAGKKPNFAHKLPLPREQQQQQIRARKKERGGLGALSLSLPDRA